MAKKFGKAAMKAASVNAPYGGKPPPWSSGDPMRPETWRVKSKGGFGPAREGGEYVGPTDKGGNPIPKPKKKPVPKPKPVTNFGLR